ncbi:MAG TPA: phosphopantetheine-binding protein [Candidatus Omnitrophota bacterium]|nr:phosphopantetheine-binding protein [Candidatus Omnitrophota bacterium]HPN65844.1 phosphopantetheine-binding protein [Candidatus Omnitrophota bacterium]
MKTLFEEVRELINEQIGMPVERILPESLLIEHLFMDFVDIVRLAIDIEEKYNITISDEEVDAVATVGELVELVRTKRDPS